MNELSKEELLELIIKYSEYFQEMINCDCYNDYIPPTIEEFYLTVSSK